MCVYIYGHSYGHSINVMYTLYKVRRLIVVYRAVITNNRQLACQVLTHSLPRSLINTHTHSGPR